MPYLKKLSIGVKCMPLVFGLLIFANKAIGQCVIQQSRTYASTQHVTIDGSASVTGRANAVDNSAVTASTLTIGLVVGSATQFLKFNSTVAAGTPVTIKFTLPTGLLELLNGVTIQTFTNLNQNGGILGNQWQADAAGQSTTNAALLGLLNGAGDQEITIIPKAADGTPVAYDGVSINLAGIAIGQSINLYGAYTSVTNLTGNVGCGVPVDVVSGVLAGTVVGGIANATGSVDNPTNAIDNNPATYAQLNTGLQALSEVFLTTIFNSESQPGDVLQIVLQDSGGGLLGLSALSGFSIQLYDGATPVGLPISSTSTFLSLTLFGTASDPYQINFTPPSGTPSYDRVEILSGGVVGANLIQGLRVFSVKRIVPNPTVNIDGLASSTKTICQGGTSTFSVGNAQSCTTYNWYDASGTLITSNTTGTYTPPANSLSTISTNQYYVEAQRTGCTETSTRVPVSLIVNPAPTIITTTFPNVCMGTPNSSVTYTSTNTPNTYSIVWDPTAISAGFLNVTDAVLPPGNITVTVPPTATPGTYNGTLTVKNANGCLSTGQPISVPVDAKPTQPTINITP